MPKGHTHLVRSALKLVSPTKALPIAKIKECMFTFVLSVLNGPGSPPGFFKARKAAKPRKKTKPKLKEAGHQPVAIAIDAPPPDPSPPPPVGAVPGGGSTSVTILTVLISMICQKNLGLRSRLRCSGMYVYLCFWIVLDVAVLDLIWNFYCTKGSRIFLEPCCVA
jgi:hypothetical protein